MIAVIALISLLAMTVGCGDRRVGKPAQDFTVTDLEGNEITLSGYRGNVVLLDFWATWCLPCIAEVPNVKRVYSTYKDDGFIVIGISLDDNRAALEAFVRREGIEWPQVFEQGQAAKVSALYRVNMIPTMFLVDREGILRYTDAYGERLEPYVKNLVSIPPR
jgi:peroxiredoxin